MSAPSICSHRGLKAEIQSTCRSKTGAGMVSINLIMTSNADVVSFISIYVNKLSTSQSMKSSLILSSTPKEHNSKKSLIFSTIHDYFWTRQGVNNTPSFLSLLPSREQSSGCFKLTVNNELLMNCRLLTMNVYSICSFRLLLQNCTCIYVTKILEPWS